MTHGVGPKLVWMVAAVLVGCTMGPSHPMADPSDPEADSGSDAEGREVTLMGFKDRDGGSDEAEADGGTDSGMGTDAAPAPEPDGGAGAGGGGAGSGGAGGTGSELPGLCEPCEAACDGNLVCIDFGGLGHTASLGQGAYCVPPCDTYPGGPGENPECEVFTDSRCIPAAGGCRPYAYPALDGIADQCGAFLSP
jgi:hypothetical protein